MNPIPSLPRKQAIQCGGTDGATRGVGPRFRGGDEEGSEAVPARSAAWSIDEPLNGVYYARNGRQRGESRITADRHPALCVVSETPGEG